MTRGLIIALVGGLASAIFFLAIRTGVPGAIALTYLASVPILAVGLSQGLLNAAIATIVACLSIALGIHVTAAGIYIAIAAIPTLIVIRQSLFSQPETTTEELSSLDMIAGMENVSPDSKALLGQFLNPKKVPVGLPGASGQKVSRKKVKLTKEEG